MKQVIKLVSMRKVIGMKGYSGERKQPILAHILSCKASFYHLQAFMLPMLQNQLMANLTQCGRY